jgi:ABC-type branched-subunit amino acid transport system permease subunit
MPGRDDLIHVLDLDELNASMDLLFNLLPHVVNGLSLGLLFALIALGFMLIVGVMELINLAHGSLFALAPTSR